MLTTIGSNAFKGCTSLTELYIPEGVTTIGNAAFSDCDSLTTVSLPEGLTSLSYELFYDSDKLTTVNIPSTVIIIEDRVFCCCYALPAIVIPNGVTSIGTYAFAFANLTTITIPRTTIYIGIGCFYSVEATSITIEGNKNWYYADSADATSGTDIDLSDSSQNASIFNEMTNHFFRKPEPLVIENNIVTGVTDAGRVAETIVVPEGITGIGNSAFEECDATSVLLPSTLQTIGESAFSGLGIESITIPNSVTELGSRAFFGCGNLTTVILSENMTRIKDSTFASCFYLNTIIIPANVMCIEPLAFARCNNISSVAIEGNKNWYYADSADATGGTNIDLSDASQNATYSQTYVDKYFFRGKIELLMQSEVVGSTTKYYVEMGEYPQTLSSETDSTVTLTSEKFFITSENTSYDVYTNQAGDRFVKYTYTEEVSGVGAVTYGGYFKIEPIKWDVVGYYTDNNKTTFVKVSDPAFSSGHKQNVVVGMRYNIDMHNAHYYPSESQVESFENNIVGDYTSLMVELNNYYDEATGNSRYVNEKVWLIDQTQLSTFYSSNAERICQGTGFVEIYLERNGTNRIENAVDSYVIRHESGSGEPNLNYVSDSGTVSSDYALAAGFRLYSLINIP